MSNRIVASAFLIKLGKHLALLACLLILGRASGRYEVNEIPVFALTVLSALIHLAGRSLRHRLALPGSRLR